MKKSGKKIAIAPEEVKSKGQTPHPNYFLIILLVVVLIGCYHVILPYIHSILIAAILASIFSPLHKRMEHLFRGKKNMAAVVSCLFLTMVVALPLVMILMAVIQQGIQSFNAISIWVETVKIQDLIRHPAVVHILEWINRVMPDVKKVFPDINMKNIQLDKMMLSATTFAGKLLIDQGGNLAGNISAIVGKFFLMLFCFFFFIRDQKEIVDAILHLVPLSSYQEDKIIFKMKAVAKSALLGTLIIAIAQGAAGGFAFWIAGLPGLFWGMVMAFASLIPMVGTSLVWIPAAGFLFISGRWGYALFMIIWCAVVVGGLDSLVRPLFMQGSAGMSTLLIFLAILGGIHAFGLTGLLYGPLLFGLAMVLLYIYEVEYTEFLDQQDSIRTNC